MTKNEIKIRKQIIEACLLMEKKGLNQGKAGNISVRWKDGMLITPSGISYEGMKAKDIVFVDSKTKSHGIWKPSSEWRFHFDILKGSCLWYRNVDTRKGYKSLSLYDCFFRW